MTSQPFDGWRDGAAWTAGFLAFPIVGTTLAVKGYGWLNQWRPMALPPYMVSWLGYAAACWISVYALGLWSLRRGIADHVFVFRRPTGLDWIIAMVGAAAGVLIIFPASQWLAHTIFGAEMRGMGFHLDSIFVLSIVFFWAVVTAPFVEEVLFRGLAVAYLQARGWPAWAVGAASCVAFAAYHLPYFGIAGAIFILLWSALVVTIRLWRGSLTPGLVIHLINNAVAYIVIPLARSP